MHYRCTTTVEVEHFVRGCNVGVIPDVDITVVLDDDGDLVEVEMQGLRKSIYGDKVETITIDRQTRETPSLCIWEAAVKHHATSRDDLMDRAGVPKVYGHEFAAEKMPVRAFV